MTTIISLGQAAEGIEIFQGLLRETTIETGKIGATLEVESTLILTSVEIQVGIEEALIEAGATLAMREVAKVEGRKDHPHLTESMEGQEEAGIVKKWGEIMIHQGMATRRDDYTLFT
jgi:hypothetical protein